MLKPQAEPHGYKKPFLMLNPLWNIPDLPGMFAFKGASQAGFQTVTKVSHYGGIFQTVQGFK